MRWIHVLRFGLNLVRYIVMVRYKVYGLEKVPKDGPFIMVTNHMSMIDSPLVAIALPVLPWRLFAGEKWRYHPILGPLLRSAGAIFINRGEVDRRALKEALAALEAGAVFGLAPEGRRSKDGKLAKGKDGAAFLASKAQVRILPLSIVGTDVWKGRWKRLKITDVEVHIGDMFELPSLGRRIKGAELAAYTHLIMVKIGQNLPPRYHGYYADSPALAAVLRGEDPWPYCLEVETAT